jgi:hypothetical protein
MNVSASQNIPLVTTARIEALKEMGYTVEDMAIEHGPTFCGCFRWMHKDGSFQNYQQSFTARHAWFQAHVQQVQREVNLEVEAHYKKLSSK